MCGISYEMMTTEKGFSSSLFSSSWSEECSLEFSARMNFARVYEWTNGNFINKIIKKEKYKKNDKKKGIVFVNFVINKRSRMSSFERVNIFEEFYYYFFLTFLRRFFSTF